MPIVPAAELERLTAEIFAARHVPRADADWIAMLLVRANLRRHDSHGAIRVPQYCAALKSGHLNPTPKIQLAVDTPTIAVLDGDHGFGQVVARRGTALAIERGRTHGLAAVALRRTSHVGRLADYAETLAAEGLVGMLWANAKSGLNVAPWGGSGKRLGTNPHAIAIPGPGGAIAMSHDFASSVWAEGKLRVKFNRGETVPSGIMLNGRGEPKASASRTRRGGRSPRARARSASVLEVVTMKEIDAIFGVTDALGIHRESLVIPLGPAAPGRVRRLPNGKLEITVDAARPIGEWLQELPALIAAVR